MTASTLLLARLTLILLTSSSPPQQPQRHTHEERSSLALSQHRFFRDQQQLDGHHEQFQLVSDIFQRLPNPEIDISDWLIGQFRGRNSNDIGRKRKRTYAMVVSYHGPHFPGGYEVNPNVKKRSVRETMTKAIEESIEFVFNDGAPSHHCRRRHHPIHLRTAGRTDAGVSAKSNLFSFVSREHTGANPQLRQNETDILLESDLSEFQIELNRRLQEHGMHVQLVRRVHDSFHATFSTASRQYLYILPLHKSISTQTANEFAKALQGTMQSVAVGKVQDYKALSSGKINTKDSQCKILDSSITYWKPSLSSIFEPVPGFSRAWKEAHKDRDIKFGNGTEVHYPHCIVFSIHANRFLRRMMRKLINGLLLDVDNTKDHAKEESILNKFRDDNKKLRFQNRLVSMDRSGNHPAPAEGLCLWKVSLRPTIEPANMQQKKRANADL